MKNSILSDMGTYLNARKVVELASVNALKVENDGTSNITDMTTLKGYEAEKALEFAQEHRLIKKDLRFIDSYTTTVKGDRYLSKKLKIPFGVFDLWANDRKVSLTVLITVAGILVGAVVATVVGLLDK